MKKASPEIVHESEAQRQHLRVQIPARVKIEGTLYPVADLSAGGMKIRDIDKIFQDGRSLDLVLELPFDVFSLNVDLRAQVEYCDNGRKVMGVRFSALSASQISILNFIIRSFMTGAVVTGDDVLNVVSRDNFVRLRNTPDPSRKKGSVMGMVKRAVPAIAIAAICLALVLFLAGNMFENMTILKSHEGVVRAEIITARSATDGIFSALVQVGDEPVRVTKGQSLGEIKGTMIGEDGVTQVPVITQVLSPCDCDIVHQTVRDGEFRAMGESVFKMIPADSAPWVEATVSSEDSARIDMKRPVRLRITGQTAFISGKVADIEVNVDNGALAIVKIEPAKTLSAHLSGRPVYVEFLKR